MRITILSLIFTFVTLAALGRTTQRSLQYYPDGEDFVCENGNNRFTRPLYGSHTAWRLETSDRPVFAAYEKPQSRNISFRMECKGNSVALDSTDYCEARYTPGRRSYVLRDHCWGSKGELLVSVLPLPDREGAVWHFKARSLRDETLRLCGIVAPIRAKKLHRSGDMGADPADCFEASLTERADTVCLSLDRGETYVYYEHGSLSSIPLSQGKEMYENAEQARASMVSMFKIDTPDPFINTLGGALVAAADGIWDGQVWLHGANGWRMPLSGWRAAYVGDCIGWSDRARTHFDNYAASQVTDVPPVLPHPTQDSALHNARSAKVWGTQMYSNGYICRNPGRNDQMHHYDMNLCYIDELLLHLCWTGDLSYAREVWPVIKRHLEWEKRNFDPDDDGLYDAYCCIWASDALYYNSGGVTHSTAYNYRANRLAADIAVKIGEDATPYLKEAEKINQALQQNLWMEDKGCWAEYKDYMGHKDLHKSPAVWTVYHAIDSEVGNMFQDYLATSYVDREIPHIPVKGEGLEDKGYQTISSTNWTPYSWSINNVAFAEVWNTALAYWQADRPDEAFRLFKSSVLDGMYLGRCPGNFGQISYYDAARGECYRDFGDPIGVASRALVQGLFGIYPDLLNGRAELRPGFPKDWEHASLHATYMDFSYRRKGNKETYSISPRFNRQTAIRLVIPARKDSYKAVVVNGKRVSPEIIESVGMPRMAIECPKGNDICVEIVWKGENLNYDDGALLAEEETCVGNHRFVKHQQGDMKWWQPADEENCQMSAPFYGTELPLDALTQYRPVVMDSVWNAYVTDIFRNEYKNPRSPYTTLQIPLQGIGDWCHPKDTADIDDCGLRQKVRNGLFTTPQGIPFRTPEDGRNIAFTTLWDNYPDMVKVALKGKAEGIYLMLAGSTNHMQCHHDNGVIRVVYRDGSKDSLSLVNPENWPPIEQDFYFDGLAFQSAAPRPYRVVLSTGLVSNDLEKDLCLDGFNDRRIPGGAATILFLPLDDGKELSELQVEARANDVVIGLMGATLAYRKSKDPLPVP